MAEWWEELIPNPVSDGQKLWDAIRNRDVRPAEAPVSEPPPSPAAPAAPQEPDEDTRLGRAELESRIRANTALAQQRENEAAALTSEAAKEQNEIKRQTLLNQAANALNEGRRIEQQIAEAKGKMPDRERLELENRLASGREAQRQSYDLENRREDRDFQTTNRREDRDFQSEMETGRRGFELERDRTRQGFDMTRTVLDLAARRDESNQRYGLDVRSQEIQRLKAQDDWVMNLLQHDVEVGKLSMEAAGKKFNAYVEKARMPTDILKAVASAVTPMIPHMTSRQAGESPMGFEAGGPLESLTRMGGSSYNPAQYAYKPVPLDMMALAKQAGANFSDSGKLPDIEKTFKVPKFKKPGGPSAVSGIGPAPAPLGNEYAGMLPGMVGGVMGGGAAPPQGPAPAEELPPIIDQAMPAPTEGLDEEELNKAMAALGF